MSVETRKVFKVTSKDIGIHVMIAAVVMLMVYHSRLELTNACRDGLVENNK